MVTKYGFSEKLGPVNYSSSEEVFLGKDFTSKQAYSEETANEIDEEVKAIIQEAYDAAMTILEEHIDQLKAVAEGLLLVETLDGQQFVDLYEGNKTPEGLAEEMKLKGEEQKEKDKAEAKEAKKRRKEERERQLREAEERKQEGLEELAELINEQGKNARFKPKVMTYNDVTNTAEPVEMSKDEPVEDIPEEVPGETPEDTAGDSKGDEE